MDDKMDNTIQPLEVSKDNIDERQTNFVLSNPEYFKNEIKIPEVKGLVCHKRGIPQTARWYVKMTSRQNNGKLIMWTRRSNIFLLCGLFFGMVVWGNIQHVMTGRYYIDFDHSRENDMIIYEKLYNRPVSYYRVWNRPA